MMIQAACFLLALLLAPLLPGLINQTKAVFAGRRGPGVFRLYADLAKLLRKSCPRSTTTTWLFDLAPAATLASVLGATWLFPWTLGGWMGGWMGAVLFFYLLGAGRFLTVLGALDTGSAFEGMGASREVQFSALVEPVVFIILGFLVILAPDATMWQHHAVPLVLAAVAFFAILLSETCRVPFDDPETHLELTMIHEAMILDNAGPDLALIHYAAALKLEILSAFLVSFLLPRGVLTPMAAAAVLLTGVLLVSVLVGIIESVMARMRFLKTPQVLLATLLLAGLGVLLFVLFEGIVA